MSGHEERNRLLLNDAGNRKSSQFESKEFLWRFLPDFFPYIPRCGLYWAYIPRFVQLRLIGVGILHKIKLDIVPTFASETKEKL